MDNWNFNHGILQYLFRSVQVNAAKVCDPDFLKRSAKNVQASWEGSLHWCKLINKGMRSSSTIRKC